MNCLPCCRGNPKWEAPVNEGVNGAVALPACRGKLTAGRPLSNLTWLRVGGPAEWLFQPEDIDDLAEFLRNLDRRIPVFALGVGSNLIVRDGGLSGVVVRLGSRFGRIDTDGTSLRAGAAALDSRVAIRAAESGLDLTFLRTIPGTLGGAVRMNAGCYGKYLADFCREVVMVDRSGKVERLRSRDVGFSYRGSSIPPGSVIVEATLECPRSDPAELFSRMEAQLAYRNETQPTGIRTAGSTFRNPSGRSSTGQSDTDHSMKAWKLIDDAGMRGARLGNACVSDKHPNFLVNAGGATATEIEKLGETVRARVLENSGIELQWEILRVGSKACEQGN